MDYSTATFQFHNGGKYANGAASGSGDGGSVWKLPKGEYFSEVEAEANNLTGNRQAR